VEGGAAIVEGRRGKVEVAAGLAGGGEPGSTSATQEEIAATVLERRREIERTVGVGGRSSDSWAFGAGGWARKSYVLL
jgi:hypothetical protein